MFVTVGLALAGLFGKKPGDGLAKIIGIISAVVMVISILVVAKCAYDRSIISAYQDRQDATNAKADLKANENASTQRAEDTSRLGNEAQELERVNNANPTDARARRVARQRCLRLQQDARAAGRQPPAC